MHDVFVVIRSAHERTERLCTQLVKKQVPSLQIEVIRERPFSFALRRSFEIGIEANREWTLCIDADVLVREGAITDLIDYSSNMTDDHLGLSGFIFDKIRGGTHRGGLHLYRTKHLPKALSLFSESPVTSRPETCIKDLMKTKGHDWALTWQVFGLHDFEQYYRDIFRKVVVRAYKSSGEYSALLTRALNLSMQDNDFQIAVWGLRIGKNQKYIPPIDADQWREEIELLLNAHDISEKGELQIDDIEQYVNRLMANEAAAVGIADRHSFMISLDSKLNILKNKQIKSYVWYIGWLLNRLGIKIQKIGTGL